MAWQLWLCAVAAASAPALAITHTGLNHVELQEHAQVDRPSFQADARFNSTSNDMLPRQLALCDCEKATGAPEGLSCEKEGWFISNFEREGSWLQGGGLVPLSHAICCRPCLPEELPDSGGRISPDEKGVAIVSIGCHAATGPGSQSLQCEPQGSSFVTGFSQAVRVASTLNAFYPIGNVDCCTPSVLLSSGDAWELERCDCQFSSDINCGGLGSHRMLQGFERWRITRMADLVPIAPAQCCKTCISDRIHPLDACVDLNFCSGHGVCNLGSCECLQGWGGSDCSQAMGGSGSGFPQWLISLIVLASCSVLSIIMMVISRVVRYHVLRLQRQEEEQDSEELGEHLMLRIDDGREGSVGSHDTDGDSDGEGVPHPLGQEAVGGGVLVAPGAARQDSGDAAESFVPPIPNGIQLQQRRRRTPVAVRSEGDVAELHDVEDSGSDGEPDTEEDLNRIEAAAAALEQRVADAEARQAAARAAPSRSESTGGWRIMYRRTPQAAVTQPEAAAHPPAEGPPPTPQVQAEPVRTPDQQPVGVQAAPTPEAQPEAEPERREAPEGEIQIPTDETLNGLAPPNLPSPCLQTQPEEALASRPSLDDLHSEDDAEAQEAASIAKAAALEEEEAAEKKGLKGDMADAGILGVECSVCMNRPVQVVVIPCGHACMCRRCSRRLGRCPICRVEIARRQRLYLGGL